MSDALLMQYLHGELDAAAVEEVRARIARMPAAAERLKALERRAARLSVLLGAADPSPAETAASATDIRSMVTQRPLTHTRGWTGMPAPLRAAALIAIVLGGVLLVEPARAWVIDRVVAAATSIGLIDTAPSAPASAPEAGAAAVISFAWSAPAFEVEAGSAGAIVLARSADEAARVEAHGAGAGIVVLARGVRLEGGAASEYRIELPGSVETIRVVRADGSATVHPLPGPGSETRIGPGR